MGMRSAGEGNYECSWDELFEKLCETVTDSHEWIELRMKRCVEKLEYRKEDGEESGTEIIVVVFQHGENG